MTNNEILARIASDLEDVDRGMFGVRDLTIGMTAELFRRLSHEQFIIHNQDAMTTLFGCKIKVFPCRGLWWIVGYAGAAEESE